MARVPVAESNQVLSGERIRNTATASPDAFGARSGRDIARVGQAGQQSSQVISQHALLFQQRQDEEAVRQAFVEYDTRVRSTLYDPETGLMSRTGRNAAGVTQEAFKTLEEAQRETSAKLNERQLRVFNERTTALNSRHYDSLARHESTEFRRAEEETLESLLGSSAESAIAGARNPQVRDQYLTEGVNEIDRIAQLHGWDADVRERKTKEFRTAVHKGIVERLMVNAPSAAKEYYESLDPDQVDGTVMATIEDSLKKHVTIGQAQERADSIIAGAGGDYRAMIREAKGIKGDPDLRDETVRRVEAHISREERLRNIDQDRAKETVWDYVNQAVVSGEYPMPEQIPGWSQLDGYTANAVINYIDKRRKGVEPVTDNVKKLEFFELPAERIAKMSPAEFVGTYRPTMADADYNELENYWIAARKASNTPGKLKTAGSIGNAASRAANKYGILVTSKKGSSSWENQTRQAAAFQSEFRAEAERLQVANGRDLTQAELDDIGARLAMKHTVDGEEVPNYQLRAGTAPDDLDINAVSFEDIPEEMHRDLVRALRKKGVPIQNSSMLELYRRWLVGQSR